MNIFEKSITIEELDTFPLLTHDNPILLIDTPELLFALCNTISKEKLLGFDTESRPSFKKGIIHGVALIQLSTNQASYLIRNKLTGVSKELIEIFENEDILKIGLSLKDDIRELKRTCSFSPKGFIDLQTYVKQFGIEELSLKKIAGIVLKKKISKRQRLSNWEKEVLDEVQEVYAAIDSLAPYLIYELLNSLTVEHIKKY